MRRRLQGHFIPAKYRTCYEHILEIRNNYGSPARIQSTRFENMTSIVMLCELVATELVNKYLFHSFVFWPQISLIKTSFQFSG